MPDQSQANTVDARQGTRQAIPGPSVFVGHGGRNSALAFLGMYLKSSAGMSDFVTIQFSTAAPSNFIPFTKGWPNRYSKAIRMLGHTYFSHVDFLLDDGNLLGASNNPNAPIVAGNPRGVAIRPPDYQSFGIRRRMVIRTDRADAILAFAHAQIGKPFDNGALSPKVFLSDPFYREMEGDRDWRNPDIWFCAEMKVCSFEGGAYFGQGIQVPIKKNRVTPGDLYTMFMMDPNFVNRDTFFDPIPTIKMGRYET